MAEQVERKRPWASWSRFEQVALISTILVWAGVMLAGAGLYVAFRNHSVNQVAWLPTVAAIARPTEIATITVTPSPTPLMFPAGWSTATPTPTPTRVPPTAVVTRSSSLPPEARVLKTPPVLVTRVAWLKTPTPTATPRVSPNPPDRIVIPKIELDVKIVPVGWSTMEEDGQQFSIWQVADYAVGWHETSAYPGQPENMVLNGHHNIRGEVFRYLVNLEPGDQVTIYAQERVYDYVVTEKYILKEKGESAEVRRKNAEWIAPTGYERLTMVTCWPYTNNTHRLVVVAVPAPASRPSGLVE